MKKKMSYYQAIREALYSELKQDAQVVLMGEDIRYNLYAYTYGLLEEFGENRVIDTPLSEAGIMGTAIGAAMCGVRPIVDLTMSNFLYVAMDQIASMAAKTIYQYNGKFKIPLTILVSSAYGGGAGAQHSDRLHGLLMGIPGIKVVVPSNPQDMYSLLRASIRDDNPVVCFQDKNVFYGDGDVDDETKVSIGKARILREGEDVSLIGVQNPANQMMEIAEIFSSEGVNCEVIDIRSLVPLDKDAILQSVNKTGRVVIADSGNRSAGAAAQISSIISEEAFNALKAPIGIVATEDVPLPFASSLERELVPTKEKIESETRKILEWSR